MYSTITKMKHFALILLAALTWSVNAQITGVSVETVLVHDGSVDPSLEGYTTYRVYADVSSSTDFISAVFGNATWPLVLGCTGTIYQSVGFTFNYANEVNPLFFATFPAWEYDSWFTIGSENSYGTVNVQATAETMEPALALFNAGEGFVIDDPIGASWFNLFPCSEGQTIEECAAASLAYGGEDNRVLIAQVTATGDVYGVFNFQVFPNGVQSNEELVHGLTFSTNPDDVFGCTNPDATNYDMMATQDDLSCTLPCAVTLNLINVNAPSCNGENDALIQVLASGAQGSDDYYLDSIEGTAQNFGNFGLLIAGTYTVYVVDAAGCTASLEVEVPATEVIEVNASLSSGVSCYDSEDAVLTVNGTTGGSGSYEYYISNNPTVFTTQTEWTGLAGGQTLSIYAIDSNGCIGQSEAVAILNPTPISVGFSGSEATSVVDATCDNATDGLLYLAGFGGSAPSTIEFSVDGENFGPSPLNLGVGEYEVVAMDIHGCMGFLDSTVVIEVQNENCGCLDPLACNYDLDAEFDDGSCSQECLGCTVSIACNYDPSATEDDGSCEFYCPGCTNPEACNFDEGAIQDDGSCEFPEMLGWCDCDGTPIDALGVCGGDCSADEDVDGICDDVDDCVGDYDECGVCNGAGAIFDCGCNDIPEGECDCEGNVLDICGVCGGGGTTCVGCIYEVACNYDPNATVLDVDLCEFGTCAGCTVDGACNYNPTLSEDDGSCDWCGCLEWQCINGFCGYVGCTNPEASNYCWQAQIEDGSCLYDYLGCLDETACNYNAEAAHDAPFLCEYDLDAIGDCGGECTADENGNGLCDANEIMLEIAVDTMFYGPNTPDPADPFDPEGELDGYVSYLVYAKFDNPEDVLSALFSDVNVYPSIGSLAIDAPCGCWNPVATSMVVDATNSSFLWVFPGFESYQYDTFWTIGMLSGSDPGQLPSFVSATPTTGDGICSSEFTDASAFVTGTPSNAFAGDDLKVAIARITTCGSFEVKGGIQVFPSGNAGNAMLKQFFAQVAGPESIGCTDALACNYNPEATVDDGSCTQPDECGICGGSGAVLECGCDDIPVDDCDCFGNQLDALGVCGGSCIADANGNGICDDEESGCTDESACNYDVSAVLDDGSCLTLDECGVCGGGGVPEGQCDCEGNVLDALGVCGGGCENDANENGICDSAEVGGPESCGWGTVWNADSGACVLLVPPFLGAFGDYNTLNPCYYDLDLSGSVGAGDLINFLGTYGLETGCSWTDE